MMLDTSSHERDLLLIVKKIFETQNNNKLIQRDLIKLISLLARIKYRPITINKFLRDKISSLLTDQINNVGIRSKEGEFFNVGLQVISDIGLASRLSITTRRELEVATASLNNEPAFLKVKDVDFFYPRTIHLELFAVCNAKCSFCDYTDLSRKGIKMSYENVFKILNDISEIPKNIKFTLQPYKISEPFLDDRVLNVSEGVLRNSPLSKVLIISNGSYITPVIIDQLIHLSSVFNVDTQLSQRKPRIRISFSLNESDPYAYKELMNLNYHQVISNLDKIHKLSKDNKFKNISFSVTRVSTNPINDQTFIKFCKQRYPLFKAGVIKLNNWSNSNEFSVNMLTENHSPVIGYKNLGCRRWFDLSIMANGDVALCCMDSGKHDLHLGNAFDENILDIYKRKVSRFIPNDLKRGSSLYPCINCSYLQGAPYSYLFDD